MQRLVRYSISKSGCVKHQIILENIVPVPCVKPVNPYSRLKVPPPELTVQVRSAVVVVTLFTPRFAGAGQAGGPNL